MGSEEKIIGTKVRKGQRGRQLRARCAARNPARCDPVPEAKAAR